MTRRGLAAFAPLAGGLAALASLYMLTLVVVFSAAGAVRVDGCVATYAVSAFVYDDTEFGCGRVTTLDRRVASFDSGQVYVGQLPAAG